MNPTTTTQFTEHVFPLEPRKLEGYALERCRLWTEVNGLYLTLLTGYSNHVPVLISPDHILNSVTTIWAKYIHLNAEKFRGKFVTHDGKKKLVYHTAGAYSEGRWPEFAAGLLGLVRADQPTNNLGWSDVSFSTSGVTDRLCRASCMLASQKAYYEYGLSLACGFSRVKLLGHSDDWLKLLGAVKVMPTLGDSDLEAWRDNLLETINRMYFGDEDFWQTAITEHRYGSGGQSKKSGWATVFNPINERGDWLEKIDDNELLNMSVDFEVQIADNGRDFDVTVRTGVDRFKVAPDGYLTPTTHFSVI